MIRFEQNDNTKYYTRGAYLEDVAVGDSLSIIKYGQYSEIISVKDYRVIKAGRRDVTIESSGGDKLILKLKERQENGYPIGHKTVLEARRAIGLKNRVFRTKVAIEAHIKEFDHEFMDAVDSWINRITEDKSI